MHEFKSVKDSQSNKTINYLDDGTFEIISDNELAEIVGGVALSIEEHPTINILCG